MRPIAMRVRGDKAKSVSASPGADDAHPPTLQAAAGLDNPKPPARAPHPTDPHSAEGIRARKRIAGLLEPPPETAGTTNPLGLPPHTPARNGRPHSYTPEIGAEICERIAAGETLTAICRDRHMPTIHAVTKWLMSQDDAFQVFFQAYRRARQELADRLADEIIEIADSATDVDSASSARVQVAARQWYASKLKPGVYGDNVNVNVGAGDGGIVINLGRFTPSAPPATVIEAKAEE